MSYFSISFFLFLFIAPIRIHAVLSVFLLGDSVTERLYAEGILPHLNCTIPDPRVLRSVETVDYYPRSPKAMLCYNQYGVVRVGYMFHWGVSKADGDYHVGWQKHRSPGDTANSIQNIKNAFAEFQQRSSFDNRLDYWKCLKYNCSTSSNFTLSDLSQVDVTDIIAGHENSKLYDRNDIVFVFLSSLWDAHRFYYKYSSKYWFTKFLDYYQNDYTSLMLDLIPILRVNDTLVLQTQHKTRPWHPTIPSTMLMNTRVQKIASFFRLPVLDVYKLLGTLPSLIFYVCMYACMMYVSIRFSVHVRPILYMTQYFYLYLCEFFSVVSVCVCVCVCEPLFAGENEAAYLHDKHHQSAPYSCLIAQSIGSRNWTVPDDCSCSSVCPT